MDRSFDSSEFIQIKDISMLISAAAMNTSKRTLGAALEAGDLQATAVCGEIRKPTNRQLIFNQQCRSEKDA